MANSEYKTIDIEGLRVSLPFRVLTSKSVYDIADDDQYNENIEALSEEQNKILESHNIDWADDYKVIKFGTGTVDYMTIDDAIQRLALKDGADLVQFKDGNLGYIGYYHGFNENWFEVVNTEHRSEHTEVFKNLIFVFDDDLFWLYEIENESEVDSAIDLIEWSISAWYNTEDYPEYGSTCIGDVIEEQLTDKCIEYEYIQL